MYKAAFDLEGPISPQDNAYEVMGLVDNGYHIFEVISKYDDVLTLRRRQNYEPGDTLKLIVPFLLINGISEADIKNISSRAKIVSGAKELIKWLTHEQWTLYVISTSYEQHAYNIASQIGIRPENVCATKLPLDFYREELKNEDIKLIEKAQEAILAFYSKYGIEDVAKFDTMVHQLDQIFFNDIPRTHFGKIFDDVQVVGGARKVNALLGAIGGTSYLMQTMVVGDSITDYKMLRTVKEGHGLSIAFNGNVFSIPYASIAIACADIRPIHFLSKKFIEGGLDLACITAKLWEDYFADYQSNPTLIPSAAITPEIKQFLLENRDAEKFPRINLIRNGDDEKLNRVAEIHKRFRSIVRGTDTAKLG